MPVYATPGVYFETFDAGPPEIDRVRLDVTAFLGLAERGPVQQPVPVETWEQFVSTFGTPLPTTHLGYCSKAFFENGGDRAVIIRIAAPEQTTTSTGVQPADRLSSVVASTRGFVPGAVASVSQGSISFDRLIVGVDTVTSRVYWESALEAALSITLPIRFAVGVGPASGTVRNGIGNTAFRIVAASPGSWANRVHVVLNRSRGAFTSARAPQSGTASTFVDSVAGFDPGAVVHIRQTEPVFVEDWRTVVQADARERSLLWDTPLPGSMDLTRPFQLEVASFGLSVFEDARLVETWAQLSLRPEHPRYVASVLESASGHIRAQAVAVGAAWPDAFPVLQRVTLAGGRDGTAAISITDFTGDLSTEQRWGIRLLETDNEVGLLAAPDLNMAAAPALVLSPPEPPEIDPCLPGDPPPLFPVPLPRLMESIPDFSIEDIFAAQQRMTGHCEQQRYRFALLDPPRAAGTGPSALPAVRAWRARFDTKFAALYYPWLLIRNALPNARDLVRPTPPCGHVAGVIAQIDIRSGVHHAPANVALEWAQDLAAPMDENIQGALNPVGINCFRTFPGRGLRLYGGRTVSSDPQWRYVNVRRLLMLIEKSVELATQWSVFEPNDFVLRETLVLSVTSFLEAEWQRGALNGASAAEAFYVQCDEENNPPALSDAGQLLVEVGVAPVIPAEFVVFRIGRTKDSLEIRED